MQHTAWPAATDERSRSGRVVSSSNIFVGQLLPRSSLRGHSQTRARIIEAEDLAIRVAFLAHHLGAHLAKANAVPRAASMKHDAVAVIADVVQVALQAVPSNVPSDGRAKSQSRDD